MITPEVCLALFIGLVATIEDIARRRISNWIPVTSFLGGLAVQTWRHGWWGFLDSWLGAIAGFSVFLVFYLLGGMGGGDIKLMAGFGAILGWKRLFIAALLTAGIGGIMAIFWIAGNALANIWRKRRLGPQAVKQAEHIPYAPAITLGVWLSLVPVG